MCVCVWVCVCVSISWITLSQLLPAGMNVAASADFHRILVKLLGPITSPCLVLNTCASQSADVLTSSTVKCSHLLPDSHHHPIIKMLVLFSPTKQVPHCEILLLHSDEVSNSWFWVLVSQYVLSINRWRLPAQLLEFCLSSNFLIKTKPTSKC